MDRRWEKLVIQTLSIVLILNQVIWSRGRTGDIEKVADARLQLITH